MKLVGCIYSLFFIVLSMMAMAQTEGFTPKYKQGRPYVFRTTVGTVHRGFVVAETADMVTIENRNLHEKMELRKSEIVSAKPLQDRTTYNDEILGNNYHADSYLLSTSAFEFKDGQVVSRNHWLVIQNLDYGLGSNWAITSTTFLFYPIGVGFKTAYRVGDLGHFGGGASVIGNLFGGSNGRPTFWGYTANLKYTHGSTNKNLTVSAGLLGLTSAIAVTTSTSSIVNLSYLNAAYCNRFAPRVAFAAEAWYFPFKQLLIGGLGIKLVGNENYSWSFGCYSFLDAYEKTLKVNLTSYPIPYLGIGRKF